MANEFPAQQPAFLGDWNYHSANGVPPALNQIRLNNSVQKNATLMFVDKITVNGIDATEYLTQIGVDNTVRLRDKVDASRWHTFFVTAPPTDKGSYFEFPIAWQAGGTILAQQKVTFEIASTKVNAVGIPMTASAGTATVALDSRKDIAVAVTSDAATISAGTATVAIGTSTKNVWVPVTMDGMHAATNKVEVIGRVYMPGQAYPSDTPIGFSPGMTLRQYYAGQAVTGFIAASNVPASNLMGGKLAEYAFKLADSLIKFEKDEAAGKKPPIVGSPAVPRQLTVVGS
jgi:hypothetical protein